MKYLIYMSSAFKLLNDEDLLDILTTSRRNNTAKNLTGMLLYGNGTFVQVLEGSEEDLDTTYDAIKADPRHRNLVKLGSGNLQHRNFAGWAMGFKAVDKAFVAQFEGYTETYQANVDKPANHPAITVLKTFADTNNLT